MYTINKRFEWDEEKARSNVAKHGVSFEEATEALTDPRGLAFFDEGHSLNEDRFIWIGLSFSSLLLVIFTHRQYGIVYRIICARRASRKERALYYEKTKN